METKDLSRIQVTIRYKTNDQESTVQVDRFPYLIGRDSSSVQLALPDATVSRTHARLTCQDDVVWLENVSATNKTAVNGQYIQQPVQLSTGDKAILGSSQLLFEIQHQDMPDNTESQPVKAVPVVEATPVMESVEQFRSVSRNAPEAEAHFCQKCGRPLHRGAASCSGCGAVVSTVIMGKTMYCGLCGAQVSENTQFCPRCGKPTRQGKSEIKESQTGGPYKPYPTSKQKRGKLPVPVIGVAALVIVIAIMAALFSGRNYEKQLMGSWYSDGTGRLAFTLYDDGTCEISNEYGTGRWAVVNDNQLKLTNFYGESTTMEIKSIKNGRLTMENGTVYRSSPQ